MLQLCTYLVARDGSADRLECHLRAIGVASLRSDAAAISTAAALANKASSSLSSATQPAIPVRCTYERVSHRSIPDIISYST